jgi:REP element-mobilizing transposase RayT
MHAMSSTYARLYVHLVWATKLRTRGITPALAPRLHGLLSSRCRALQCVALAVGGVEEHVHVLVGLHPSVAVADLVRELKTNSSAFMHDECGVDPFAWQEGYGAFTLRDTELDTVREYIRNQPAHHDAASLVTEWERVGPPRGVR